MGIGFKLCLLAALGAASEGKKEAKLQGYDLLCPQMGGEVRLRAKVERKGVAGIHPDLHGEEILFYSSKTPIGKGRSGKDGIAELIWTFPHMVHAKDGPFHVEVEATLSEGSEYEAPRTRFGAFHWRKDFPVLVVDLDGTVCASTELEVGLKAPGELRAVPGAPEALQEIARTHALLYLTARDDALMNATREWLDLRTFPKGPVLFRDLSLWNLSAEKYKREKLLALKKDWNLVAGVGDRDEDARAYMAAGMEAYLVGRAEKVPQGARKLASWAEVAKILRP